MSRRKQAKPQQLRSDEDPSLLELLPEHGERARAAAAVKSAQTLPNSEVVLCDYYI